MPNCVAWLVTPGRAHGRDDQARARAHHDRAARLRVVAAALDRAAPGRRAGASTPSRSGDRAGRSARRRPTCRGWSRRPRSRPSRRRCPRSARAGARRSGRSSTTVEPGARPIVISATSGTRVASPSTSSSGAPCPGRRQPQLEAAARAPRSSWRRQPGQSMRYCPSVSGWKTGLSPLQPTLVLVASGSSTGRGRAARRTPGSSRRPARPRAPRRRCATRPCRRARWSASRS